MKDKPVPDTPWDWHIGRSVGVVWGVNVGTYGSPMECLAAAIVNNMTCIEQPN